MLALLLAHSMILVYCLSYATEEGCTFFNFLVSFDFIVNFPILNFPSIISNLLQTPSLRAHSILIQYISFLHLGIHCAE